MARFDAGGALRVGPESAGADPGPICYGRGTEPTVTDANLLLGRLQPQRFLGGDFTLDLERTSRLVLLARMEGATAEAALAGFTSSLNRVHMPMRKTMTYDQGKEMSRHKELTAVTGVTVYFADPHSPWQRGSNENTNGLLREYLPKGTDLSGLTQEELDAIAWKLNTRPRKLHGFRSPIEVYDEHLAKARTRPDL